MALAVAGDDEETASIGSQSHSTLPDACFAALLNSDIRVDWGSIGSRFHGENASDAHASVRTNTYNHSGVIEAATLSEQAPFIHLTETYRSQ